MEAKALPEIGVTCDIPVRGKTAVCCKETTRPTPFEVARRNYFPFPKWHYVLEALGDKRKVKYDCKLIKLRISPDDMEDWKTVCPAPAYVSLCKV